ncbi:hypothetical protein CRENBAI_008410 [Crenichthys baileyi]|uniref:Uncharacterized protein n=1 Tax=Crenichthys baileyi TaxID=28760 RepID=A0AAV9S1A5_9TELE
MESKLQQNNIRDVWSGIRKIEGFRQKDGAPRRNTLDITPGLPYQSSLKEVQGEMWSTEPLQLNLITILPHWLGMCGRGSPSGPGPPNTKQGRSPQNVVFVFKLTFPKGKISHFFCVGTPAMGYNIKGR